MVSSPSSARSPTRGRGAGFSSPRVLDTPLKVDAEQLLDRPGLCTRGAHRRQLGPRALCRPPRDGRCAALGAEPGDAHGQARPTRRCRREREAEARTVSRGAVPGGSEQARPPALPSPALQTCRRSVARAYTKAHARESGPLRGFSRSTHLPQPPEAPPTPRYPSGPLSAQTHARTHAAWSRMSRKRPHPVCVSAMAFVHRDLCDSSLVLGVVPVAAGGPQREDHARIHPRGGGHRGLRCGPSPQERTPTGAAFLVFNSATEQQ